MPTVATPRIPIEDDHSDHDQDDFQSAAAAGVELVSETAGSGGTGRRAEVAGMPEAADECERPQRRTYCRTLFLGFRVAPQELQNAISHLMTDAVGKIDGASIPQIGIEAVASESQRELPGPQMT